MPSDKAPPPSAQNELDALRGRVAELERERASLLETNEIARRFFETSDENIAILENGYVIETNPRVESMFGYTMAEAIGKHALDFIAPESRELVISNIKAGYEEPYQAIGLRKDGSTFIGEFRGKTITYKGHPARATIVLDITARKLVERIERDAAVHQETLRTQTRVLRELSIPLLPIGRGTLLLPLVGELDEERAKDIQSALLSAVATHRAAIALLDITGVPHVDTTVADMLINAARAVRLLGANVVLTGIGPHIARTFVQIGADLSWIQAFGTLEQGVAFAFGLHR